MEVNTSEFDPVIDENTMTAIWTIENAKKWYYQVYLKSPHIDFKDLFSFEEMIQWIEKGEFEHAGFVIKIDFNITE